MFGYIVVNQDELKIKEYNKYKSYYCGLCQSLKKSCGLSGQIILSYDMTFLIVLLEGLYEKPVSSVKKTCIAHPSKKQNILRNEITEYAADMSLLLMYYKLMDNWFDDKDMKSRILADRLRKKKEKIAHKYKDKCEEIAKCVRENVKNEKKGVYDIDLMAGISGKMLGAVFSYRDDEWSKELRTIGFYLGKFIYLLDAYEDLEEDIKKHRFNVWLPYKDRKDFDACVENTLTLMMSDCARSFERLPIVQDADILRNIIYSGVWTKYNEHKKKKEKEDI